MSGNIAGPKKGAGSKETEDKSPVMGGKFSRSKSVKQHVAGIEGNQDKISQVKGSEGKKTGEAKRKRGGTKSSLQETVPDGASVMYGTNEESTKDNIQDKEKGGILGDCKDEGNADQTYGTNSVRPKENQPNTGVGSRPHVVQNRGNESQTNGQKAHQNRDNKQHTDRRNRSQDDQNRGNERQTRDQKAHQNRENTQDPDRRNRSREDPNRGNERQTRDQKAHQNRENTQVPDRRNRSREDPNRGNESQTHDTKAHQNRDSKQNTERRNRSQDDPKRETPQNDDAVPFGVISSAKKDNEPDFTVWARTHHLDPEIIHRLKEEELDDLKSLGQFPEDQISLLKLKSKHETKFRKAFQELQKEQIGYSNMGGPHTVDSKNNGEPKRGNYAQAFERLLQELLLEQQTIETLEKYGMDCPEALATLDNENIDILCLSSNQRGILEGVIANMRGKYEDQDFCQWLQDIKCDQAIIDQVFGLGIECPKALITLDKHLIYGLKLSENQRTILEDVVEDLSTSAQGSEVIGVMKQLERGDGAKLSIVEICDAIDRFRKNTSDAIKPGSANAAKYLQSNMGKQRFEIPRLTNEKTLVKLPVKQVYEDREGKIRKCILGRRSSKVRQKTVMLVGATGVGKSSLIDGMCNYIFDVKQQEKNRFQLIDQHKEEEQNAVKGQTVSQTEWITIYTIYTGQSNRLPYTLNVIDTPGFGDTRGINRDQTIVDQIKFLFENREDEIDEIDAVCFVAKAPDARLTPTQRYIYQSISSVFGKNIEFNILAMITFADAAKPPVLEAIKDARLPYIKAFSFNNSALLANYDEANEFAVKFGKMFWDMGVQSFNTFFDFLETLTPKSLCLPSEVIEQRQNLKKILLDVEHQIYKCLAKMAVLKGEEEIFRNDLKTARAKNGKYSSITYLSEEEEQINDNLIKTKENYDTNEKDCIEYIRKSHDISKQLEQIAHKPEPLTEHEYIEKLIATEKFQHNDGWRQRVQQLEAIQKNRA